MFISFTDSEAKRYFDLFQDWNGSILERLQDTETVGEMKSRKERIIKEVKAQYFPKAYEKKIIQVVRDIYDNQEKRFN